jgi:hypothetical protein
MRLRSKHDANSKEIIATFKASGCTVLDLQRVGGGCPDILVAIDGNSALVEIKTPVGKLTEGQMAFKDMWKGKLYVVRTCPEAINVTCMLRSRMIQDAKQ